MEKDESREAATSSDPCFHNDSKSSAITQHQRAKFQELQQRRLQMKTKTKNKRKPKDNKKILIEDVDIQGYVDNHIDESLKDSSVKHCSKGKDSSHISSSTSHVDIHPALNKKKLHWGLDTKARWERKANM